MCPYPRQLQSFANYCWNYSDDEEVVGICDRHKCPYEIDFGSGN